MEKFETIAIHGGEELASSHRAITAPIFQTSTFELADDIPYHEIRYTRMNNTPTHLALHAKLAALEGGEACLTFGSGMAAISAALMTLIQPGEHLLVQSCIYGGTFGLLTGEFKQFGFSHSFIDGLDSSSWEKSLRPETRAIYVESIANPQLTIVELEEIVRFAKKHGLLTLIDNTFASPYNFQPLKMGFDVSIHSATKYLNGHADVIAGCLIGAKEHIQKTKSFLSHVGATLDPLACFLLDRGVKTLSLRMERHNFNAQTIAEFLEKDARVKKVFYPGLRNHPNHEKAVQWFRGFGGVLSFELDGDEKTVSRFLKALKMIRYAPSLGGVESLVVLPAKSSHAGQSAEELKSLGFDPLLIRLAVGIESADDLIAEIDEALSQAFRG